MKTVSEQLDLKFWATLLFSLLIVLGVFFTVANIFWFQPIQSRVDKLETKIDEIYDIVRGKEGIPVILERLKGIQDHVNDLERRLRALEEVYKIARISVSSEGGEISLVIFNPSEQLFHTITIKAPAGWVSQDTSLQY